MFEQQIAYWLNVYLGKYVHGLDAESLRISVWQGDVELRNLALKPEALQDLDLPITVKAGVLGRLTLKACWGLCVRCSQLLCRVARAMLAVCCTCCDAHRGLS
jgi:hypothetical protein